MVEEEKSTLPNILRPKEHRKWSGIIRETISVLSNTSTVSFEETNGRPGGSQITKQTSNEIRSDPGRLNKREI